MRGILTPLSLARVTRGLAVSRKEGVLHVSRDGLSKRIYFKEGKVVFAGTDDEQERLGEVLIRAGKLKRADLDTALRLMKETGESLGKSVVDMGFISATDITLHALERTKSIIVSVFSWPSGEFHFEEREASIDEDVALELSTTEMILEGIRGIEDPEIVRRGLGDLTAVLREPEKPLSPYQGGSLSSSVEWILYQASGVSTIEEIAAGSPMDQDETLRSVFALVAAGILELESPEQAMVAMGQTRQLIAARLSYEPDDSSTPSAGSGSVPASDIPHKIGRYDVKEVLGRGAMGAVYLANDPAIGRDVAIKLIQTSVQLTATEFEQYRERFYREAKSAGKLLHPGVVTVFDVGHTVQETPFIVMEYVQGSTLEDILETSSLQLDEVLRLSGLILDALAYAHEQGIVHRDVKPANIVVTADGQAKIMDFGIAHVVGSDFTQVGEVLGSPNYMAPEQLSKESIDQRTDVFAFGVILYRMLTGKLPFTGDSFAAIAKAILFDEPTPPQNLNPSVTTAINSIVLHCLSKRPAHRFATAKELQSALASSSIGTSVVPFADVVFSADASISRSSASPPTATTASELKRSMIRGTAVLAGWKIPKRFVVMAGAALLVIAISLALVFSRVPSAAESSSQNERTGTSGAPIYTASNLSPTDKQILAWESTPDTTEPDFVPEKNDAELYHEANVAFDRGELETSKATLEKLLQRNPGFEGAPELVVKVNEQVRSEEQSLLEPERPAPPTWGTSATVSSHSTPNDVDVREFYEARLAFENGDLEESQSRLQALLRRNPSFAVATELLANVNDAIWKKALPMSFRAKHNHRIGDCAGTLTLAAWGIRYSSKDHEWDWDFDNIRVMQRPSRRVLLVETYEAEVLGLGKPKNYKFELNRTLQEGDWARYQRLSQ